MHALPHLSAVDWISLVLFFACWGGYAWFSEHSRWGDSGLVRTTQTYRLDWARRMLEREIRVADSTLIGNLMTSVSFYANTTIYIIAGLVAALGASDKLISVTAELPFGGIGNRELLEIKLMLVLASFVFAYFKFTWSLRQFNLLSILVGAAPQGQADQPANEKYAQRVAGANNLAGDDFNRGIRAYYFGLAASGWLLSPLVLGTLALTVLIVLYRRDFPLAGTRTPARQALSRMNRKTHLAGIGFGLLAYGIWGFFPLYFRQLSHISPMDVLSNRAVWSCVFVGILLTLRQRWGNVLAVFKTPRQFAMLALAALLVASNWLMFLWAVSHQQVVASSLGYFLTPLVNVLLGLLVLKERLNKLEWISVGFAVAAIINEVIALGSLPWVSLFLAATFGTYGLVRKQVPVDALSGLWLETLAMLPICGIYAIWQFQSGHLVFAAHETSTAALLVGAGILTAVPLMAFAAATQRLDLATVGMLMYINPTMQFITAIWIFGEPLQTARLVSFGLIWIGLFFFSWSMWQKLRRH
jgi:chloramphenicol-sensitive protein RarD